MKVKELLGLEVSVDVYDNVCEELAIAFDGPVRLTEEGTAKFGKALDFDVYFGFGKWGIESAIVDVDGKEGVWQENLKVAKSLFDSIAGYCASTDWDKWFIMD